MAENGRWADARNLLCVRLDTIGDVLMTTPAIRAFKHARPRRRITLLTSPVGASVASMVPEIDDVIAYDAPWMKSSPPLPDGQQEFEMAARLAAHRFDAAAIFTVYSQSPLPAAMLLHLAGVPLRLAHCRENPYQLLTDWVREPEPERFVRHEVRRHLDLAATVGATTDDDGLSLRVPAWARVRIATWLAESGLNLERPWGVVHPGATAPSRRYPPHLFAAAVRELVEDRGWQIVFTGQESEAPLVEQVRSDAGVDTWSTAGALSLPELAALLEQTPLLIANNTGVVHIGAAVGTPVVDLYALTNPQHTPWGVPSRVLYHDVPCKYCYSSRCPEGHHACLAQVPSGAVVEAASSLLDETWPRKMQPR